MGTSADANQEGAATSVCGLEALNVTREGSSHRPGCWASGATFLPGSRPDPVPFSGCSGHFIHHRFGDLRLR